MQLEEGIVKIVENLASKDPSVYIDSVFTVATTFITWVLGFVFCPYILVERDNLISLFNRICLLFIKQYKSNFIHHYARKCHTIFALQPFDGLLLGPAILGESVGISPFWIIFAITVFGGLFGFIGMFLGVPWICIIRMFFNDFLTYRKNKKVVSWGF